MVLLGGCRLSVLLGKECACGYFDPIFLDISIKTYKTKNKILCIFLNNLFFPHFIVVTHTCILMHVETYALHFSIGRGFKPLIALFRFHHCCYCSKPFLLNIRIYYVFSTKFPKHMLLQHLISCVDMCALKKMSVLSNKTETVLLFEINLQQIAGWHTHTHRTIWLCLWIFDLNTICGTKSK